MPPLYLSAYFEKNRDEYYANLLSVSQKSTRSRWINFFLHGVIAQSSEAIRNIRMLANLRTRYEERLRNKKASRSANQLLSYLFANPVITIPSAGKFLDMAYPSAKSAVEYLERIGVLKEVGSRRRNRMFLATEILDLLA